MTVSEYNGTALAGGWNGIYRSINGGSTWTLIDNLGGYSQDPPGGDTNCFGETSSLHTETWNGVQQFLHTEKGDWLAVIFMKTTAYAPTYRLKYGLWRSADDGATFNDSMYIKTLRRGIAADSCGYRLHLTSGDAFSAGPDRQGPLDTGDGEETIRWSGGSPVITPEVTSAHAYFRNRLGGRVTTSNIDGVGTYVWVGAPGYGVMLGVTPTMPPDAACETQLTGGGGGMSAGLSREESAAPVIGRRVFKLAEVRGRTFFDLSGRKVSVRRSGVYFDPVIKDGRIVSRRTVLVTP